MTLLLTIVLCVLFAYGLYIASLSSRRTLAPEHYLDAGQSLPSWVYIFAGTGVAIAALGPYDHFRLLARYGLQYNQVVLGLILVALCAALFQKRVWLASRIAAKATLGELFGEYYDSIAIRLYLLLVLLLFAVPFSAYCLGEAGDLLAMATQGEVSRLMGIGVLGVFLFLFSVIGGWRGVVFVMGALTILFFALVIFIAGFAGSTFSAVAILQKGFAVLDGTLPDTIPGVIQFTRGLGKQLPNGGIWTTVASLSFALSAVGVALSPGFTFLGITSKPKSALAFNQVWMIAGLAAGILLLLGPVIGGELQTTHDPFAVFTERLAGFDQLIAVCFVMLLAVSLIIAISFFTASGANIFSIELLGRFVLPRMTGLDYRLAARVTLAIIYAVVIALAAFAPAITAVANSVVLGLSVQLLPAFLGLCWLPWISRSAVISGLILGTILVLFTEPPGLILFEGLFTDLPWGRWPLTIHSAAWGLFFNVAACLLVSLFTKVGEEREHREALHAVFRRDHRINLGGRAARGARWSLSLLWIFLALGPGAMLGNTFFSQPIFSGASVALGAPSLWVWQIVFWLFGVLIVWWLAYQSRMSVVDADRIPLGELAAREGVFGQRRTPGWIAALLARIAGVQSR